MQQLHSNVSEMERVVEKFRLNKNKMITLSIKKMMKDFI